MVIMLMLHSMIKIVQTAWIRISSLLYEAGLAGKKDTNLSVKIKIDTRPPEGAHTETRAINRHFSFALRHHDLLSLMAGKCTLLQEELFPEKAGWYKLFEAKTRALNPADIKKGIEPFLENPEEADLLKPEILLKMLLEIL